MPVFFKKHLLDFLFLFVAVQSLSGQIDFSNNWEDYFSYNNVKDFFISEENIYAIADNAAFIYINRNDEIQKISSVHGLSGKETTSLYFSRETNRFVIGYQSGLIEIIDENGKITVANDIERLDITGQKQINHISEYNGKLYLSTPFGIVVYDIVNLNFGDTYYIDENSNPVYVNETLVYDETIYAVSEKGIYTADAKDPNLIDFNNWLQPEGDLLGNFRSIAVLEGQIFTCRSSLLYQFTGIDELLQRRNYNRTILNLRSSQNQMAVNLKTSALVLDKDLTLLYEAKQTDRYEFDLNSSYAKDNEVYLATKNYGVLKKGFVDLSYQEIHPEGPSSNKVFSIEAMNNNLWVVYGGYNLSFDPLNKKLGFSHYNGSSLEASAWVNVDYNEAFPAQDLVHITIDPEAENKAYLSSWGSGMMVVEDDEPKVIWDDTNSGLEDLYQNGGPESSIRVNGASFDNRGNFWIANAWVPEKLKKLDTRGNWSGFDLSSIITDQRALGLTELIIDKSGSIWIGSRRNGALVYNESGDRKRALVTESTKGSLPDLNVRTLAVDRNNRIWIGTQKGLVVFSDASGLFEADIYDAQPVIIDDNGIPKRLLGDQPVNSIAIDGAENKWFGTDTGGVLGTNPSGSETLYNFNKDNSPLPSNSVLKIKVDDTNGKVFFATDKGIVAFNSGVAPFGESLKEVYAFPNPVKKEHEFVTIDGRNGTHLPKGTNVKILDIAGRLVYETNVDIGQEIKGGKVIWNKTNLRGRRVASGVYIVLLTSPDKSETASTKIALIN
ncbi:two-component regulator propeller domain-containing protein [Lutimonas zeaxanthinifaciens]|uniref:type IX secretion system anionic LPS delivery protein PorZ n=1 Tax=Lutimonas zeaxanthinifaciens TaxID=3060215 RepID=UPI00265D1E19|nr:two-component regulator propeller domain-containing protein [Lutimonas sp. YSD2104]WKK66042.1 two-component regulator propeller domain-containing protein [Lutimonas sp. YSD2104]